MMRSFLSSPIKAGLLMLEPLSIRIKKIMQGQFTMVPIRLTAQGLTELEPCTSHFNMLMWGRNSFLVTCLFYSSKMILINIL
ncbi:hypothetical protein D3C85_1584930 [compost metagenome]